MEPEQPPKKDDFETPESRPLEWPMLTPQDSRLVNMLALAIGLVTDPRQHASAERECQVFQTLSFALVERLERRGLIIASDVVPVARNSGVTQ